MRRAVVVGAGPAGLAAALALADGGLEVTVLEQRREPGGRIRRIFPGGGRAPVDCGQHLMLGCYRESFAFLKRIGISDGLFRIDGPTPFVSGDARAHPFRIWNLPPPLHLLPAVAGLTQMSIADRLALGLVLASAKLQRGARSGRLDEMSAEQWLKRCRQGGRSVSGFWEPLVLATLNMPAAGASALLLATVIEKGFLAGAGDASPMLPRSTLHDLLVAPAAAALQARGGRLLAGQKAVRLLDDGAGRLAAVVTEREDLFEADVFVLAVPSWDVAPLAAGRRALLPLSEAAGRLGWSSIITVHLWFDRPWMKYRMAGLLGGAMHWVFSGPEGGSDGGSQRVTMVLSSADGFMAEANAVLVERCVAECERYFPESRGARLGSSLVLKARRSTIRGAPGQHRLRDTCKSPYRNARIAGDWTATGLPATIEGAIASGARAAGELLDRGWT